MFRKTIKHVPGTPIQIYDHETGEHVATGYLADDEMESTISTEKAVEAIKTLMHYCDQRDDCTAKDCPMRSWCEERSRNEFFMPVLWEVPEI